MIGDAPIRPVYGQNTYEGGRQARNVPEPTLSRTSGGEAEADELSLSPESLLYDLCGVEPGPNGSIRLGDICTANERTMADFNGTLAGLLREAGVDRSEPFTLRSDAMGRVYVEGDHADKEKIEAIFEQNPQLANQFRKISATSSLLRAAEQSEQFQKAYAQDPYAAVQRYSYLFDGSNDAEFGLAISADAMEPFFSDR